MRQLWINLGILIVLVFLLAGVGRYLDQVTSPLLENVSAAMAAAAEGDWEEASVRARENRKAWEWRQERLRVFEPHSSLEEISGLVLEAEQQAACHDLSGYVSVNTRLLERLRALQRSERLTLGNLL